MTHVTHVTELLPGYALNCSEPEEIVSVTEHLATCRQCREELAAYQAVTDYLLLAAPDAQPSPALKNRLMTRIRADVRPVPARGRVRRLWQRFVDAVQPVAPAWGLTSAVALMLLSIGTLSLWQRLHNLERFYHTRDFQLVKLECTHVVPEATGQIVVSNDGALGMLAVAHLPVLEPGYTYQIWLVLNGQRMNGGTFLVNQQGYGMLTVASPESLLKCEVVITIEPEQGSAEPTGKTVLTTMI